MKIQTNIPVINDSSKLLKKLADFWNETSVVWREVWGPHIHHGFFDEEHLNPVTAQEKMIDKLVELIDLKSDVKLLDVGCGMGGTSIYLAKNYKTNVTGITLSDKQVKMAQKQAQELQLLDAKFYIEDAHLLKSFSNETFDVVWSLESCEQFYDKEAFLKQAYRVLKPDGRLMLATWCSGQNEYEGLQADNYCKLCQAFDTPYMPTMDFYAQILQQQNFKLQQILDWSGYVKKSWDIGITNLKKYSLLKLLLLGGLKHIRFLRSVKLMQAAFREGQIKYGVFVATKHVMPAKAGSSE